MKNHTLGIIVTVFSETYINSYLIPTLKFLMPRSVG